MSKKELLERLSRTPSEGRSRRTDTGASSPTGTGDKVTTQVKRGVIRRRARRSEPRDASGEAAPARRRAVSPQQARVLSEGAEQQEAPAEGPSTKPEVAPETPSEAPKAEAPAPDPTQASEEPRAESPTERTEGDWAARASETPSTQEPAAASSEQTDQPAEAEDVPERPRYEGLGKAVVAPPPGYDPTNPAAFRRQVDEQPAPPRREETFGRRRKLASDGGRGDGRPRRSRRSRAATPFVERGMPGMRRRPRRKSGGAPKAPSPAPKASKRKIRVDNVISVGQLAHELGVKAAVVIKELMNLGQMATVNEMLDVDTASLIAAEFEYEVENVGFQEVQFLQHVADEQEEENLQERAPVVTIMGHVDHGKTTLLDAVRAAKAKAKVAGGEAGGITQHIGAYQVEKDGKAITFVDTPGHAAFTAMRARGASVTDIVVLVVAADDGVQPQTEEAINHAKAAGVPIIVAINKMDKAGVSPDPIKQKLVEFELQPEDWGGDVMFVPISALKGEGLDDLLEAILLQAEMQELKANPDRPGEGVVVEAKLERGRGVVATLLVQKGTLKRGDNVAIGTAYGRVRALLDPTGKKMKEGPPSTPVEIFGLSDMPEVGSKFHVVKSEKDARTLAEHRQQEAREAALAQTGRRTAADIFAAAEAADQELLNLVIKADVQGSLEALKGAIEAIEVDGAEARILHGAVGDISESDINLAAANGAMVIGFNVKMDAKARKSADAQGVEPQMYSVIYAALDAVKERMSGLLAPEYEEVKQGLVEVRATFDISRHGRIAGCYVLEGKVGRNHGARLLRDGQVIWEGRVATLKRFKEDAREVATGYECGMGLQGFNDIQVGDQIETFTYEEVEATA